MKLSKQCLQQPINTGVIISSFPQRVKASVVSVLEAIESRAAQDTITAPSSETGQALPNEFKPVAASPDLLSPKSRSQNLSVFSDPLGQKIEGSTTQSKSPQPSDALHEGIVSISESRQALPELASLVEAALEWTGTTPDSSEEAAVALQAAQGYRNFLLGQHTLLAAVRDNLEHRLAIALSDQDGFEPDINESLDLTEGESDFSQEPSIEESPEVAEARARLALFDSVVEEISAIPLTDPNELSFDLEQLSGSAQDLLVFQEGWLHEKLDEKVSKIEALKPRGGALLQVKKELQALEAKDFPEVAEYDQVLSKLSIYELYYSAVTLSPKHPALGEIKETLVRLDQGAELSAGELKELQVLSSRAALQVVTETKIDALNTKIESAEITDALINGAGLWDTGVQGAKQLVGLQDRYIEVKQLIERGDYQEAGALYHRIESDMNTHQLNAMAMDSELFNQCTALSGVVILSSITAGVASELVSGYVATGLSGARGLTLLQGGLRPAQAIASLSRSSQALVSLSRFSSLSASFTASHQYYDNSLHGKPFFDPKMSLEENLVELGKSTLTTAGMFLFLGGASRMHRAAMLPKLRELAMERALLQVGGDAALVSQEMLASELKLLTQSGVEALAYRSQGFMVELGSFGLWDEVALGLEQYLSGAEAPEGSSRLFDWDAWVQRFTFLISLKAGHVLAKPLQRPMEKHQQEITEAMQRNKITSALENGAELLVERLRESVEGPDLEPGMVAMNMGFNPFSALRKMFNGIKGFFGGGSADEPKALPAADAEGKELSADPYRQIPSVDTEDECSMLKIGENPVVFRIGEWVYLDRTSQVHYGTLAKDQLLTVGGNPVFFRAGDKVFFYGSGQIFGGTLVEDTVLTVGGNPVVFRAGERVYFDKNGRIAEGTLSKDRRLNVGGNPVVFRAGERVAFDKNGRISEGTLAKDTALIVGRNTFVFRAGDKVFFDATGEVEKVILVKDTVFKYRMRGPFVFQEGERVYFNQNGYPVRI